MKTKALLFTQGEGGTWEAVPFELFKEGFDPSKYEKKPFKSFSVGLGIDTQDINLLIEETPVFALAFSDGSFWDSNNTWRPYENEEWVNKVYKDKTQGHEV